jgi:hypothetical protein
MVLFWSIRISKRSIVRDSKASGKSFQKYVDKLSKEEAKINKVVKELYRRGEASPRTSRRIKI